MDREVPLDDQEILRRCREGEVECFGLLVNTYERELMKHALMWLGCREDALDAVQETLMKAFRALSRFHLGEPVYPWLYGILRNTCIDMARRHKQTQRVGERIGWSARECFSSRTECQDRASELWEHLAELEADDREILVLKHVDGHSYDEIASLLGIPAGTVMSRLSRARARLRSRLEGRA